GRVGERRRRGGRCARVGRGRGGVAGRGRGPGHRRRGLTCRGGRACDRRRGGRRGGGRGGRVGVGRRRGHAGQHRAQVRLAGHVDEVDGLLLVVDSGQVDDDRVVLADDLRFTDAEAV